MGAKAKGKNKRKNTTAPKAPKVAKDTLRPHEQRQQAPPGR